MLGVQYNYYTIVVSAKSQNPMKATIEPTKFEICGSYYIDNAQLHVPCLRVHGREELVVDGKQSTSA